MIKKNNVSNIIRRPAQESDIEFARLVHHKAYRDVVVRQFGIWDEERQDKYFKSDWSNGDHFEIIICEGKPCGYRRIDYFPTYIVVHELVILPKFQGQGIGTRILQEVIEIAKSKGLYIKIGALKENKALNLYRKLGFKDVDSNDSHIGLEYCPKN